jgi:hypothetical protein
MVRSPIRPAIGLAAVMALLAPAPAAARDHYYFNRPNVSREAYAADIAECTELAGGARAPKMGPVYVMVPNTPYGAIGAGIGILFAGLLQGNPDKRVKRSVERTCMADKGYGRFEVEEDLIDEIKAIADEQARLDRMFALASAENPIGRKMAE